MTGFVDVPLPYGVKGWPASSAPRWSTTITGVSSGAENVNQNWAHPLHTFRLAEAVRDHETFTAMQKFWLAMRGPAFHFPYQDPLDFATQDLPANNFPPVVTRNDQVIGTGDGLTRTFQLSKAYSITAGIVTQTYSRTITLPDLSSVLIGVDGLAPGDVPVLDGGPFTYDVTRPGGVVTFDNPPEAGAVITWGGLFDVPVRFEADNSFEGIARTYRVSGFADLVLIEKRPC